VNQTEPCLCPGTGRGRLNFAELTVSNKTRRREGERDHTRASEAHPGHPLSLPPHLLTPTPPQPHISSQGIFRCRPNSKNHRDLDIEIDFNFDGKFGSLHTVQPYRLR
jgi:hypothetical protein